MEQNNDRTLDQINNTLHLAKLKEQDMAPLSQTIYFTPKNLYHHNYKLLQLDNSLLNEITEGKTLFIKGDDEDNAVLCTEDRTYDINEAETSNSLLLCENLKFYEDAKNFEEQTVSKTLVCGIFYNYLEAVSSKPHLKKFYDILDQSVYRGPEYEHEINSKLYSFEELSEIIQASKNELKQALKSKAVIVIDNKIRLLDFEYHFKVLTFMLKLIDENSWALDEIDFDETLTALKDLFPDRIIDSLFERYTVRTKIIDGQQLYKYKEDEVCKFFAQVLLYEAGKFNLSEFLQAWSESVPEGMITNEEMLYGIAVIDRTANPNTISAFDETQLPEDINKRFTILFQIKDKWTVPEITPYIQKLATDKLDVNALLAKYARSSHGNGIKYYSAKHAK